MSSAGLTGLVRRGSGGEAGSDATMDRLCLFEERRPKSPSDTAGGGSFPADDHLGAWSLPPAGRAEDPSRFAAYLRSRHAPPGGSRIRCRGMYESPARSPGKPICFGCLGLSVCLRHPHQTFRACASRFRIEASHSWRPCNGFCTLACHNRSVRREVPKSYLASRLQSNGGTTHRTRLGNPPSPGTRLGRRFRRPAGTPPQAGGPSTLLAAEAVFIGGDDGAGFRDPSGRPQP